MSNTCGICSKEYEKPRSLPCEHDFCKHCLQDHISACVESSGNTRSFHCPVCRNLTELPNVPIGKCSNSFKLNQRTRVKHDQWTQCKPDQQTGSFIKKKTLSTPTMRESEVRWLQNDLYNARTCSYDPTVACRSNSKSYYGLSHRRTAVRYSGYHYDTWFTTKISSDKHSCVYWGGDVFENDGIVLADWINRTIKIFNKTGEFVCKITLENAPLDVITVKNNRLVVSYGSSVKKVSYLHYDQSSLQKLNEIHITGYLYNITRFEELCLGIYEERNKICLVTLKQHKSYRLSIGRDQSVKQFLLHGNILLSSASAIFYCGMLKKIFVTTNKTLYCLENNGHAVFECRYQHPESEFYPLSSVTCNYDGIIYVASENCLLKIKNDGELICTMPTKMDPYYIMTYCGKIVLISKSNDVDYCIVDQDDKINN